MFGSGSNKKAPMVCKYCGKTIECPNPFRCNINGSFGRACSGECFVKLVDKLLKDALRDATDETLLAAFSWRDFVLFHNDEKFSVRFYDIFESMHVAYESRTPDEYLRLLDEFDKIHFDAAKRNRIWEYTR